MTEMLNISDQVVTIKIAHGPGEPPTVTTVAPGESGEFHDGYCKWVRGAGKSCPLMPIVARLSRVDGLPRLVLPEDADKARARWDATHPVEKPAAPFTATAPAIAPPPLPVAVRTTAPPADDVVAATTPTAPKAPKRRSKGKPRG